MLPQGHVTQTINIHGGQGGSGGEGYENGTGGPGGPGHGPTLNVTAQQIIAHNLYANSLAAMPPVEASQIVNHCPPPSRIFQGRQNILDKMHHFFIDGRGGQHIYVLYGLGGAGKTQTGLKFIQDLSSQFSDIFFVDTSTKETIDIGLKNIAIAKHCGNSSHEGLQWLTSTVEEWLLFLDNADDPNINLNDFIPQCHHGNIIITSRNPGLRVYGNHSSVSEMDEKDAVTLLLESAGQADTLATWHAATEIVKTLGYLALAIVQAGAFISKSGNLTIYLDLYAKQRALLLSEKPVQSHDSYAQTVYTTWQMSFEQLKPPAQMFLQICSYFHHNGISEEIFCNASKFKFYCGYPSKEELQRPLEFLSNFMAPTGEWDTLSFMNVTSEIQAYSLINFDPEKEVFSIHPLVHAWSQEMISDSKSCQSSAGAILAMAFSEIPSQDQMLASLLFLPHVESISQFNTDIAPGFQLQYAEIFLKAGKYKQAEKLQVEVLEKWKEALGDNDRSTLIAMGNLAVTYSRLGEFKKSQELEIVVLEKRKQLLGDNHPETLTAMGNLANTYSNLGEFKKAQELDIVVLEKRKQFLGDNHPEILNAMGNLASTYSNLGEFKKAQELENVVLEKWKQFLGDNHPETLATMAHLARTYSELGEFKKAQELEIVVLEKLGQLLGDNHPETLKAMGNLASTYSNLGEFKKAQELKIVVLEKLKQFLGDNHPHTLTAMGNLASTYRDLGELKKAQELEIVVLEKKKQFLGDNHPDTLIAMANLAHTYWNLRDFTKAEELELLVLERCRQILGDNHPDTLHVARHLSNTYRSQDKLQEAKELRRLFGLPAFENTTSSRSRAIFKQPVKRLKKALIR
ncbi:FabD/lysophospholipase-like protein [Mycena venus]|uniref:FabD/lysophospholipase-like protein n=1 Tax=Mycena venus TaxID=2733690 RepID=A0A8H6XN89_9AGAR|nr:FabD/lysophospholipase-like protein [Mycena venus]